MSGVAGSRSGGPPRIALDTQVVVFAGEAHQVVLLSIDREHGEVTLRLRKVNAGQRKPGVR